MNRCFNLCLLLLAVYLADTAAQYRYVVKYPPPPIRTLPSTPPPIRIVQSTPPPVQTLPPSLPPEVETEISVPDVDKNCLLCICQANSKCNLTIKCVGRNRNQICGPYGITWTYWHDAGRMGDYGGPKDFEDCANSRFCAEQTVRGYMRRYGQDCDENGEVTCDDFVRIHKLGPGGCGDDSILDTDYMIRFDACYFGFQAEEAQL